MFNICCFKICSVIKCLELTHCGNTVALLRQKTLWNMYCLNFIYKDSQGVTDEQTYKASVLHGLWDITTFFTGQIVEHPGQYTPLCGFLLLKSVQGRRIHLNLWWFNELLIVCEKKTNKGAKLHYSLENTQCTGSIKDLLLQWSENIPIWCI